MERCERGRTACGTGEARRRSCGPALAAVGCRHRAASRSCSSGWRRLRAASEREVSKGKRNGRGSERGTHCFLRGRRSCCACRRSKRSSTSASRTPRGRCRPFAPRRAGRGCVDGGELVSLMRSPARTRLLSLYARPSSPAMSIVPLLPTRSSCSPTSMNLARVALVGGPRRARSRDRGVYRAFAARARPVQEMCDSQCCCCEERDAEAVEGRGDHRVVASRVRGENGWAVCWRRCAMGAGRAGGR